MEFLISVQQLRLLLLTVVQPEFTGSHLGRHWFILAFLPAHEEPCVRPLHKSAGGWECLKLSNRPARIQNRLS